MKALRARCSGVILVIAVLLSARVCCLVLLADAGRLRQQDLNKRGQLRPKVGLKSRNGRPVLEQIPLAVSLAPHPRLPRGGAIPVRMRLSSTSVIGQRMPISSAIELHDGLV